MPVTAEDVKGPPVLATTREPSGPARSGDVGSLGDRALMDALLIVILAWVVILVLVASLYRHSV